MNMSNDEIKLLKKAYSLIPYWSIENGVVSVPNEIRNYLQELENVYKKLTGRTLNLDSLTEKDFLLLVGLFLLKEIEKIDIYLDASDIGALASFYIEIGKEYTDDFVSFIRYLIEGKDSEQKDATISEAKGFVIKYLHEMTEGSNHHLTISVDRIEIEKSQADQPEQKDKPVQTSNTDIKTEAKKNPAQSTSTSDKKIIVVASVIVIILIAIFCILFDPFWQFQFEDDVIDNQVVPTNTSSENTEPVPSVSSDLITDPNNPFLSTPVLSTPEPTEADFDCLDQLWMHRQPHP